MVTTKKVMPTRVRKLDVGCGGSEKFRFGIARRNINCDILKPSYRIPNFVRCDAHHLPFKDNCFCKVMMFHVIEHLGKPLEALGEARIVLKEGGVLNLATPNALYLAKIVMSVYHGTYTPSRDHIATWGEPELKNLLCQAGFDSTIKYETYRDPKKIWYYEFLVKICPFPAIRHRQLHVIAKKKMTEFEC